MSDGPSRSPPALTAAGRYGWLWSSLAAGLFCLAAGLLGTRLAPEGGGPSLFWPPTAVALASLLLIGWRSMPVMWAATLGALLIAGMPVALALAQASANLAGAALAAGALKRLGLSASLRRRRDLVLLVAAAALGPLLSGAITVLASYGLGLVTLDRLPTTLWCLWGAEAIAVLCVTPLLFNRETSHNPRPHLLQQLAFGSLALAALLAGTWAFFGPHDAQHGLSPWLFIPGLLLIWMGLRFDELRLNASVALMLVLEAALATGLGRGPFVYTPASLNVALLWSYSASLAAIPLVVHVLLAEMRGERRRWRDAFAKAGLGMAEWDLQIDRCDFALHWPQAPGVDEGLQTSPSDWLEIAHPLDREPARAALTQLLQPNGGKHGDSAMLSLRLPTLDSRDWRWHELHLLVPERDRAGAPLRLAATLEDAHWRHTAEERQRMSVSLFQHLHEGLLVTDAQHQVLDANPSYCRMLATPREALCGQRALPLEPHHLLRSGIDPLRLQQQIVETGHWQGRVQCQRPDGQACTLQLTVSAIPEPKGPVRYHVVAVADLTQQMQQQALLERQARHDVLTGLPNQDEFRRRLEQALSQAEAEGFRLCVACLDLDLFKRFNAQAGPAVADRLLVEVAKRLQTALRSAPQWSDELARLGGDEFGLILRCRDAEEAERAAERMLNVLRMPFKLEGVIEPLELTGSLGATLYPLDHSDAETLLRHAAHALYRVKRSGRNAFQFFDTQKRLRNEARVVVLGRMQEALDAGELQLHYQPKVDLRSARVLGVEALLRWQHPERGLLTPAHFLPEVESTGLGVRIGDWVIEQALRQSARWLQAGLTLQVSVNVSARHLQSPDFVQRLQELLARHSQPVAQHLVLELLESTALADIVATQALIRACRKGGVRFALDDFGTGYSTLTYLKQLTIDTLKIDRSFVQNMLFDPQDRALVGGVIGLARDFGCDLVAEGVESAAHASALLAMGCDVGQGLGIADAMPAEAVADWMAGFQLHPTLSVHAMEQPA